MGLNTRIIAHTSYKQLRNATAHGRTGGHVYHSRPIIISYYTWSRLFHQESLLLVVLLLIVKVPKNEPLSLIYLTMCDVSQTFTPFAHHSAAALSH